MGTVASGKGKSMAEQRLIDANAILYCEAVDGDTFEGTGKLYARKEDIDALPTIEERKTGKWVQDKKSKRYRCDQCLSFALKTDDMQENLSDFCPVCGAKMEHNEDDQNV